MNNSAQQTIAAPETGPVKLPALGWAVFVFYLVALFLNAEALQQSMELMRYGPRRDAAVAMIKPIAEASRRLGFGKPRQFLEQTIGVWIKP